MKNKNFILPLITMGFVMLLIFGCKKKDDTSTALAVGQSYQGGVIAYISVSGDPGYVSGETHGLIATPGDVSASIQWYNGSYVTTNATSASAGNTNTETIVNQQGAGSYAAKICYDLSLGGYSDWYLPSKGEMLKLWANKATIGGFTATDYWTSTEYAPQGQGNAWYFKTNAGGSPDYGNKANVFAVRAVRAF